MCSGGCTHMVVLVFFSILCSCRNSYYSYVEFLANFSDPPIFRGASLRQKHPFIPSDPADRNAALEDDDRQYSVTCDHNTSLSRYRSRTDMKIEEPATTKPRSK